MHTLDAIMQRRAVKHYDPEFIMPEQDTNRLLNYMLQAPTSFNLQHWKIVKVDDKRLREDIREAAWGQQQITDASLLFVLCANTHAWQDNVDQSWRNAPEDIQEMMKPMIHDFYQDKPQLQRDEAIRSVGILAQTTMLAAKALGYDSCPMMGFDSKKVAELIHLPPNHLIGMIIVVGKAIEAAKPKPGQLPLGEVLVTNRFMK